jgi:hypothetical protein
MVSVDVAGQPAKPAMGTDGTRVPLLRPGFRPSGSYQVSFVYLHAGTPFSKKGDIEMTLPKMDMPVGIVEWELFAPERYSMKSIGGNAIDLSRLRAEHVALAAPYFAGVEGGVPGGVVGGIVGGLPAVPSRVTVDIVGDDQLGQIRGVAKDPSGAVLPGVTVEVASTALGARTAITDGNGRFVMTNVPAGQTSVTATLLGFTTAQTNFDFDQRTRDVHFVLSVSQLAETITVAGAASREDMQTARQIAAAPSQNVVNLQQRATGVLPVRIDVPRAGTSHQFVKPLVVDQETTVKLRYKRR